MFQAVFSTIIERLGTLQLKDAPGNEASFERAQAVLDSLASVKSCVIVVEFGDSLTVPFFESLLAVVQ